jgi:hypothetical protein
VHAPRGRGCAEVGVGARGIRDIMVIARLFICLGVCAANRQAPPADTPTAPRHALHPGYTKEFSQHREHQGLPDTPLHPPRLPARGAVETGVWRNLFVEMGIDAATVERRVDAVFAQLFFGNADNERLMFEATDGSGAYILSVDSNDVRSEGMSYGMMIAAQRDNATMFDALWRWAKTHMRHNGADDARHGYFAWHCSPQGVPLDANPASDGETWMAAALYMAAARWQRADYAAEAASLLQDCACAAAGDSTHA